MGRLSRSEIIAAGLAKAGNNSAITTEAVRYFQATLDRVYAAHEWPFLVRTYDVAIAAGQGAFLFGDGSPAPAAIPLRIQSIKRARLAGATNDSFQGRELPLRLPSDLDPAAEPSWNDSTPGSAPTRLLVDSVPEMPHQWRLTLVPYPDTAYRLRVTAHFIPAALVFNSDIPAYPADETLIEMVVAWATFYNADEREAKVDSTIRPRVVADFISSGSASGRPGTMQLSSRFRVTRR